MTSNWLNHTVYPVGSLCYFLIFKILEKKTKNKLEDAWRIRTLGRKVFLTHINCPNFQCNTDIRFKKKSADSKIFGQNSEKPYTLSLYHC